MKNFTFKSLILILLMIFGMQNAKPAKAVAPDQIITITVHAPASAANGESFTVAATADSSLDVTYSAVGVCTNVGATFTMTSDSGTCIVQYDQAGDVNYNPAQQVTEDVTAQAAATATTTPTPTETSSLSPTGTMTATESPTATELPTETVTPTATASSTSTPTSSPTVTTIPPSTLAYVSTTGDDSHTCTDPTEPCLTINGALSKIITGGTVKVAIGTYTGTGSAVVAITKSAILLGGWDVNFTAQTGQSTIDGGNIRGGINLTTDTPFPVTIDSFIVRNGYSAGGGGISNTHTGLTITNSQIVNNVASVEGGGIFNYGNLTINNTIISGNTANDGYGGGIVHYSDVLTINNTSVTMNTIVADGSSNGSGILNEHGTVILNNTTVSNNLISGSTDYKAMIYNAGGDVTLNNSTISGATQKAGIGIAKSWGNIDINNSTIANNQYGIVNNYGHGGKITLRNSIVAQNNVYDCRGPIVSLGHNLLGNTNDCKFTTVTGDITNLAPKLGQMTGFPGYIPLLIGSPAINTADSSTCLPTDQRGLPRPQGIRCDMGSYEYKKPGIASVLGILAGSYQKAASGANFDSNLSAYVLDQFGSPVQGVKVDFTTPSSGPSATFGASHTASATTDINGIATAPVLTANNEPGRYTVSITSNGLSHSPSTFALTNLPIPVAISPVEDISITNPTYKWTKVIGATQYQIELLYDFNRVVFTKTVAASVCGATSCSITPSNALTLSPDPSFYKWRVRALFGSTWQAFSSYKIFQVSVRPGFWSGNGVSFYVAPDHNHITNTAIYLNVKGCGKYKITSTKPALLSFGVRFALYTSSYNIAGRFSTITSSFGTTHYFSFYIKDCGYVREGDFNWTAAWKNGSSPTTADIQTITVIPSIEPQSLSIPNSDYKIEAIP